MGDEAKDSRFAIDDDFSDKSENHSNPDDDDEMSDASNVDENSHQDRNSDEDEDGNHIFTTDPQPTDNNTETPSKPVLKPLNPKQLKKFQEKINKTGILYLSRIPPFMKPVKLRHLLSQYAKNGIGRIYLAPEDSNIAMRRKKYRGNKRINYTEGWVEFNDKNDAKAIAGLLNGQPIGGKKRDRFYDDLWTLKYLPKFKWNNLNEQIAYERAVREHRLRTEMQQAHRENKLYIQNVSKSKMVDAITERKKKRKVENNVGVGTSVETSGGSEGVDGLQVRKFKQRKVVDSSTKVGTSGKTEKVLTSHSTSANTTHIAVFKRQKDDVALSELFETLSENERIQHLLLPLLKHLSLQNDTNELHASSIDEAISNINETSKYTESIVETKLSFYFMKTSKTAFVSLPTTNKKKLQSYISTQINDTRDIGKSSYKLLKIEQNHKVSIIKPVIESDILMERALKEYPTTSWGLDRIDQKSLPLDGKIDLPEKCGVNSTIFIIDTGIDINHVEFQGRAQWGASFTENGKMVDDHGHGTFVAAVAAGSTFGVAKYAKLVAVKALDAEGSGTAEKLIQSLQWISYNYNKYCQVGQCVVNMSLGSSERNYALNSAVAAVMKLGIHVAVAAGNDGVDACTQSPGSTPDAITVGATDSNDIIPSFSNTGRCVALYAPGVKIVSASIGPSHQETSIKSGTSMSAPFVAGSLALALSINPSTESGASSALLRNLSTVIPYQRSRPKDTAKTLDWFDWTTSTVNLLYIGDVAESTGPTNSNTSRLNARFRRVNVFTLLLMLVIVVI